jgi:hypothetical protein
MGTPVSIEDSFTHGGQHRTMSPKTNVVPYAVPNGVALAAFKRRLNVARG